MKQKVSRIDYSKAMLPRTRREQFLDCFKMNYSVLVKCGLLLLLFALPLIAFCIFMDFYYVSIMEHTTEAVEQTRLVFFYLYNIGVVVFCFPIVIALSGVIHILRNFIWGEGLFFKSDIIIGIKENTGKNALFLLIFGIFYLLSYFIYSMFRVPVVSYFPLVLFAFVLFPIFLWCLFLNNTYKSNFGSLFRNSAFFYVKSIGWSLLGALTLISLVTLLLIPLYFVWLKYIIVAIFFLFVLPIIILTMILYTTSKFDEYINKENYSTYYLKGLNHD